MYIIWKKPMKSSLYHRMGTYGPIFIRVEKSTLKGRRELRDGGIRMIKENTNNPNAESMEAMNEYYEMEAHPDKYKRYSSFRDAMNEVLADDDIAKELIILVT